MKQYILTFFIAALCWNVQAQKNKTENIVIITLDGFRWQELFYGADSLLIANKEFTHDQDEIKKRFWAASAEERRKKLLPFLWNEFSSQGQLLGNRKLGNLVNCSNSMWFSYPGYNEILSGFADDQRINSNDKIDNPNVTVLEFLNNQSSYKGKVAAFGSWDVFPFIINRKRSNIPINAGFETSSSPDLTEREKFLNEIQSQIPAIWGGVRYDAFTHHYAMEYVKKKTPKVLYISYGETDDFAHDGDYSAYLRSAYQTDQFIAKWWRFFQNHPQYKGKTTILITTDHGRGTQPIESWKSHGSKIKDAGEIWMAAIGPDTPAKGEVKEKMQLYQNQLAKTAAALLSVDYKNDKPVGDVISIMIKK